MLSLRKIILVIILSIPLLLKATIKDSISVINLYFSENKGQWPEQVLYKAPLGNGNLWIEKNSLHFDLYNSRELELISHHHRLETNKFVPPKNIKRHNYKLHFLNSNPTKSLQGMGQLFDYENYYIGKDHSHWASKVHKYASIKYKSLYDGIDLHIYQKDLHIKWDFIVKPHANANKIQIRYEGVNKLDLKKGNLIIHTSVNTIIELAPIAYQYDNRGKKHSIKCRYKLKDNTLSFKLPKGYNSNLPLIIDPTLVFASYTGSAADNWGFSATYDSKGFLYAAGIVFSSGYPVNTGAFYDSTFNGTFDVSISKFDTSGTQLIYSTYLGGAQGEVPASMIVNSNNELLVLGTTSSLDFPTTTNAYDNSYNGGSNTHISSSIHFINGSDLFVTHFNSSGTQLIGSTYFGGNANDGINSSPILVFNYGDDIRGEIMTDINDNIYIVSSTTSTNIPTTAGVFQPTKSASEDGLIAKFDDNLSTLIWASYFGGNGDDAIYGIKINKQQDLYITGGSSSTNLPTTNNTYQTTYPGGIASGYIAKINQTGQNIKACTYVGSAHYDQSYLIDIDRNSNVYVFGQTQDSSNAFIINAQWNSPNDGQFISKFNSTLTNRIWSTTWGNGQYGIDVVPSAFMVDLCNRIYLSAWGGNVNHNFGGGNTNNLPLTSNAIQSSTDGSDYYLMVMADDASSIDYGSYYGGNQSAEHVDGGTSRFDNKGRIYQNVCAGCGGHSDFPTTVNAFSRTNNSYNCNNGVFKIDFNIPAIVADFIIPPVICAPDTSIFTNTSFLTHPNQTHYLWNFGDSTSSTLKSPIHVYNHNGIFNVKLIISDSLSCNLSDTISKQVVVLSGSSIDLSPIDLCPGYPMQIGILPVNDTNISYNWTPSSTLSDSSISNPYANPSVSTLYKLIISNGLCADTIHQLVREMHLQANAGNDTTLCLNSINLTGHGNLNGLLYQWSHNSSFSDTLNNFPYDSTLAYTFSNPQYLYFKISKNGCSDYDSIYLEKRITIVVGNVKEPLCHGDYNGSISIQVNGGATPINYAWSNGQNTATISNLGQGNYHLNVTDADGCSNTYDTTLNEPPPLTSRHIAKSIPCASACIGKAYANPQGGTPPYHWQWDDGNSQQTNPAIQLCAGVYHAVITDSNNCLINDTVVIIDSSLYISFNVWADQDSLYKNNQTRLHSTNLGSGHNYLWTPSNLVSNPTSINPRTNLTGTTTYIVEATDNYGCHWSDTITIYVSDVICNEPYIYVPNAFTPNGDGKNDLLKVKSSVGYDLDFMIYDRLGELIFETKDINKAWDGTYRGQKLAPGVYIYHLKLQCFNREVFLKKGNITLIR